MKVEMVHSGIYGSFPSLCHPDHWVTLGVFWKDHSMTSCVLLCSQCSHCAQSTQLLSRWLYLILLHLNSFGGCLVVHSGHWGGARCRSKVGTKYLIP